MELKLVRGCICDGFTIDGKNVSELTHDALGLRLIDIVNRMDRCQLERILHGIVEDNGDYEDLGFCGDCGDTIVSYTLEL